MATYSKEENRQWQNNLPTKPVGASVVLRNKNGQVLVVKPNYRDEWNLPGGVVDEKESPLAAAIREVREELGLELAPQSLRLGAVNYTPSIDGFIDFMTVVFDGGTLSEEQVQSIQLQEKELDEHRFVSTDEAKKLLNDLKGRSVEMIVKGKADYLVAQIKESTEI